mgnify:CR=1 FL=1
MWPCGVHSHGVSIVGDVRSATSASVLVRIAFVVTSVLALGACAGESPEVPLGPAPASAPADAEGSASSGR